MVREALGARRRVAEYGLLALFAAVSALFLNQLFVCTGLMGISSAYSQVEARQYGLPLAQGFVLYGVVSPVIEEFVFRGIFFRLLSRVAPLKGPGAVALSALLFAVYHRNLVQGLYAFPMGVLLALCYDREGSILAPIVFHGCANAVTYLVSAKIGFPTGVSGNVFCVLSGGCLLAMALWEANSRKKEAKRKK